MNKSLIKWFGSGILLILGIIFCIQGLFLGWLAISYVFPQLPFSIIFESVAINEFPIDQSWFKYGSLGMFFLGFLFIWCSVLLFGSIGSSE